MTENIENLSAEFVTFCIEQYKKKHNLSGNAVFDLFDKLGVNEYLAEGYEVLHTQGKNWLMEDIEEFISNRTE